MDCMAVGTWARGGGAIATLQYFANQKNIELKRRTYKSLYSKKAKIDTYIS